MEWLASNSDVETMPANFLMYSLIAQPNGDYLVVIAGVLHAGEMRELL